MAFQDPDPSEDGYEQEATGGAMKKIAPIAALGGGLLLLVFLLSLAF